MTYLYNTPNIIETADDQAMQGAMVVLMPLPCQATSCHNVRYIG